MVLDASRSCTVDFTEKGSDRVVLDGNKDLDRLCYGTCDGCVSMLIDVANQERQKEHACGVWFRSPSNGLTDCFFKVAEISLHISEAAIFHPFYQIHN